MTRLDPKTCFVCSLLLLLAHPEHSLLALPRRVYPVSEGGSRGTRSHLPAATRFLRHAHSGLLQFATECINIFWTALHLLSTFLYQHSPTTKTPTVYHHLHRLKGVVVDSRAKRDTDSLGSQTTTPTMSAPNEGRQSPDPERQSGAQQQDTPAQPGSGKVSTLPSFRSIALARSASHAYNLPYRSPVMVHPYPSQYADTKMNRLTTPSKRMRARTIRPAASRATQSISSKMPLRRKQRRLYPDTTIGVLNMQRSQGHAAPQTERT